MTATVGVNLLWLVPGVVGGSEEYVVRHLHAVGDLAPDDLRLRLYVRPELAAAHPVLVERFAVRTVPAALRAKTARIAAEHSWLARVTRFDDLVHHPGGVVPLVRSTPTVVTIHDLQPLDLPANFSAAKRAWLGFTLPRSVRVARLVLTPSRFTADRVRDRLGADPEQLRVVPHGHAPVVPGPPAPADAERLRGRYGRYLLYPTIAYPHKRHVDLLDAFARLAPAHPDLQVVLTGGPASATPTVDAWCDRSGLGPRVHRLGRVSEPELDELLRGAAMVVVPSEYEGFGNPALEGLLRGTPTVVAAAGSLPEVVGDAALTVPPRRPDLLADAIGRVLDDPGLATLLRRRGPERAARFDDRRAAEALVLAYRDALAGPPTPPAEDDRP
jgi:glycosyltransferase involved in cell wall biosynthesis